jgi:integrase
MPCLTKDRKSGIFFAVYSVQKKRVWKSTGTRDRHRAVQFLTRNPAPDKIIKVLNLTNAISEFLESCHVSQSPKMYRLYELTLRQFLKHTGDIEVETISPRQIESFKVLRLRQVSASTINMQLRTLRAFFNKFIKWEQLQRNPARQVDLIKIPESLPAYHTPEQLTQLLSSISDKWLARIVLLGFMTGLRLGEILNLTWEDIDLKNRIAIIRSSLSYQVKAGKMRTIPLNDESMQVLNSFADRDGLVFKGKHGQRANPNFVSAKFREAIRKSNLDQRLHFHSLRHSFASILVKNGVSLFQVQRLLGHSTPRLTMVYAHLQSSEMHDVVNLISLKTSKESSDKKIKASSNAFRDGFSVREINMN